LRSSAFHAFVHSLRALAAATCSIAISSPAANARLPLAFTERSHAWAVTLSWCSPRTVWSLAAARPNAVAAGPAMTAIASAA